MSDIISRKYIIQAHKAYCEKHPNANWYKWSLSIMQTAPSVERTGKWEPIKRGERGYSAGDFRCSLCERPNKCYSLTNYCPHCGAHMRGDNNG